MAVKKAREQIRATIMHINDPRLSEVIHPPKIGKRTVFLRIGFDHVDEKRAPPKYTHHSLREFVDGHLDCFIDLDHKDVLVRKYLHIPESAALPSTSGGSLYLPARVMYGIVGRIPLARFKEALQLPMPAPKKPVEAWASLKGARVAEKELISLKNALDHHDNRSSLRQFLDSFR